MYYLKNVYGVLSFNRSKVSVLVVEKANNNKINTLYFDYFDMQYLNDQNEIINKSELTQNIINLLIKADHFIGRNIQRYVINISYLQARSVKNISKDYELNGSKELEQEDLMRFIKNVNFLDEATEEKIISVHPYQWTLDGINHSSFPMGKTGKNLNFEYVAYVCNKKMYDEFKELAINCKIYPLAIINNQIAYSGCLTRINNNKKNLVIDIKSDCTSINFYNEHNHLIYSESIDSGSNWMVDNIKNHFGIPDGMSINFIVDSLESTALVSNDLGLVNIHKESFLSLKVATNGAFISYIKRLSKQFFELINSRINNIMSRISINYDYMYVNGNNMAIKLLNLTDQSNYQIFKNNIIGIEDKNVANMLGAVDYINNYQKSINMIKYSIDPFVSQNTYNGQLKKDLLLKVGLITTKWAAKLGG